MLSSLTGDHRFRVIVSAAAVVIIAQGLREAAAVLNPILMAGVVVACAAPLNERLLRRGLGRGVSMTLTSLTVVMGLLAFIGLIGYAGRALVQWIPQYQEQLTALFTSGATWLDARGIDASQSRIMAMISPGRVIAIATRFAEGIAGAVSVALLIVLLSIFLLIETSSFWRRAGRPLRAETSRGAWYARLLAVAADVQQYVWITLVTGAMFAAAVWLLLVILGVDMPVLWAVFALVLSFVPGVGFVLSMIPPTLLALLEFGVGRATIVAIAFIVLNNLVDNVIKPRFMKQGFDMGPFVMFASILTWAYIFGATGALLAVPLTMAVRRLFIEPPPGVPGEVTAEMAVAVRVEAPDPPPAAG